MLKAGAKLPPGAHRHVPEFLRLLRAGSEESSKAGGGGGSGYAPLLALLRGMSASAIDRELRAMQVLEGSDAEDQAEGLRDLRLLMACLGQQLGGGGGAVANFEFCQGLLQLTLQVSVGMGVRVPFYMPRVRRTIPEGGTPAPADVVRDIDWHSSMLLSVLHFVVECSTVYP